MREQFLKLFIDENETFCVSPNKYGYHSVGFDSIDKEMVLVPPPPVDPEDKLNETLYLPFSKMAMLALNPIDGFRRDDNCTAFRSFLIECDDGSLQEQYDYVKSTGLPYSACVFSGNKSLHFAVCLDQDVGSLETYNYLATWMLNIVHKADQSCKNPSRSIRMPGIARGKKMQALKEMSGRISLSTLNAWLSQFPGKRPDTYKQPDEPTASYADSTELPAWINRALKEGVSEYSARVGDGRNNTWFKIFRELRKIGINAETAMVMMENDFIPEKDFTKREWRTIAVSAVRGTRKKK